MPLMKPNIFLYKNLKNEDHFTNSMGYLLNLFPRQLGDRFISKLATIAGLPANSLGKFVYAEFTGHVIQNKKSTSKPDLIVNTDKLKLFFEIKLTAPLSNLQLERHLSDVKNGKLILISNVRTKVTKFVSAHNDFLKPLNHDHFFWTDLESVFQFRFRKNSLEYLLLSDFQKSLRANDIKARHIFGAEDNLYFGGSKAQILALNFLSNLLVEIGFKVWSLPQEHTIRVYPKTTKKHPLINPIFFSTGESLSDELISECLIVFCFADRKKKTGMKQLQKVEVITQDFPEVRVFEYPVIGYYTKQIYIPLEFISKGNTFDFNREYLKSVWSKLFQLLQ